MKHEIVDVVTRELKAVGIKPTIEQTSRHIAIRWIVAAGKEQRTIVTSCTPSDWRTRLNTRAEVRRYLRADGVNMSKQSEGGGGGGGGGGSGILAKALQPPTHVEPLPDQVKMLRAEVADLTDMMLCMTDVIERVAATLIPVEPLPSITKPPRRRRRTKLEMAEARRLGLVK